MHSAVAKPDVFTYDQHYLHVRIRGREFWLTRTQAAIVRHLHLAAMEGQPWVHVETLREGVGFETAKLSDLFRRQADWQDLIQSDRRGSYRLNL